MGSKKKANKHKYQVCPLDDTQVEDISKGKNKYGCGKHVAECIDSKHADAVVTGLNMLDKHLLLARAITKAIKKENRKIRGGFIG